MYTTPSRYLRPPGRSLVALGVGVVLIGSCAEPERPADVEPDPVVSDDPIEEPDDRDELLVQLDVLRTTLAEIQEALTEVAEANSLDEVQPGVDRALASLVVERDGAAPDTNGPDGEVAAEEDADEAVVGEGVTGEGAGDVAADEGAADEDPVRSETVSALLPSQTLDRSESAASPDLLSATMTLASDVGGDIGRDIAGVLRDPIAGDLGAWQRDPAGMVALAERAATSTTDLTTLETTIRELEGEGTRALAWTFVAEEAVAANDLELARGAAERALAHVQIMLLAVEDVGAS